MTWGAPITFGRHVGKVTTTELRMGIVKNGSGPGVLIVVPGVTAEELRWTAQTSLDIQPGEGAHHGWVRLSPSQSPGARRIRTTGKSKNLRLVTPMWPWLIGRGLELRALEVVEHRMGTTSIHGTVVDVRLPAWAEPEAPRAKEGEAAPGPAPGYEVLRSAPEGRGKGLLLDTMPHPLPPNLAPRRAAATPGGHIRE